MSRWGPCKRTQFIKALRNLSFEGPYSGGKHQFMIYHEHRMAIPSNSEYSVPQLRMMIREIEIIINRSIPLTEWIELQK